MGLETVIFSAGTPHQERSDVAVIRPCDHCSYTCRQGKETADRILQWMCPQVCLWLEFGVNVSLSLCIWMELGVLPGVFVSFCFKTTILKQFFLHPCSPQNCQVRCVLCVSFIAYEGRNRRFVCLQVATVNLRTN